uniref:Uncharacterized protein n=1 Tax=Odontella aurita TaxID=265563 RepID=A0A7S4M7W6_9STRA|mmetsp:Transcript_13935/g.40770  ORF Transcript_13935/g.40770 Transcript_13935/m.40770 type:complete len:317 (+) Transcript_13935:247-1197(+)
MAPFQRYRFVSCTWARGVQLLVVIGMLYSVAFLPRCESLALPSSSSSSPRSAVPPLFAAKTGIIRTVSEQYRLRTAADPDFARKSIVEILLAAGTQLMAEASRRGGPPGLAREVDFVFAGVLTAIAGKYYSMWRVAQTVDNESDRAAGDANVVVASVDESGGRGSFWTDEVPTNAFQPYLLDGRTRPTMIARMAALVAPIPSLFRAGIGAAATGYGLAAFIIRLRMWLLPDYVAQTVSINVIYACLYTGGFMALVSNLRYQLLQGVIEPMIIDRALGRYPKARSVAIVAVRYANGVLGSCLAIMGMKAMGLQKLKS